MELPKRSRNRQTSNGQKASGLSLWGKRSNTNALAWVDVDARIVTAALAAITSRGGALMLGTAQGGRGVTVTAFLDGERAKDYAATVEELEEMLLEVVDSLGSPAEDLRSEFGLASSD